MEAPLSQQDSNYPKAKYRKAPEGDGDVKSPAYEKITTQNGEAKRVVEFHPYQSTLVRNADEEAALVGDWYDSPTDIGRLKVKPEVKAKPKEFSAT